MSVQDIRDHHANWVTPISTTVAGMNVYTTPPSSQGLAALQMLLSCERPMPCISSPAPRPKLTLSLEPRTWLLPTVTDTSLILNSAIFQWPCFLAMITLLMP